MNARSQLSNEAEVIDSVPEAEKESVATWHSRQAVLLCLLKALYYAVICSYTERFCIMPDIMPASSARS